MAFLRDEVEVMAAVAATPAREHSVGEKKELSPTGAPTEGFEGLTAGEGEVAREGERVRRGSRQGLKGRRWGWHGDRRRRCDGDCLFSARGFRIAFS